MKYTAKEIELENGVKGILIDMPSTNVVDMQFFFRSGYIFSEQDKYELPHAVEHMVFSSNKEFDSKAEFKRELHKYGAYSNAYTSNTANIYHTQFEYKDLERVLDLHLGAITGPIFNEKELVPEMNAIREELLPKIDNHSAELDLVVMDDLGYGYRSRAERIPLLKNIKNKDIKDYYSRTHTKENFQFIISGKIEDKEELIKEILTKHTENLPSGERLEYPKPKFGRSYFNVKKDASKAYYDLMLVGKEKFSLEERYILYICSLYLAGPQHSVLSSRAREAGLSYYLGSNIMHFNGQTIFSVAGSVVYEKDDELFEVIAEELKKIMDLDFDKDFWEEIKTYKIGSTARAYQTASHISSWYFKGYLMDEEIDISIDEYTEFIENLDFERFQKVVKKFFDNVLLKFASSSKYDDDYAKDKYEFFRDKLGQDLDAQQLGVEAYTNVEKAKKALDKATEMLENQEK